MSQNRESVNESSALLNNSVGGEEKKPISFFAFFRYLSTADRVLLYLGTLASILAGMILPSISVIMGNVTVAFTGGGSIVDEMNFIASYVVMISVGLFITSYIFFAFWSHLAENIAIDLRRRYLKALMR